jgi:hypothetical protein
MEPRNYESGAAETPPTTPETPSSGYPIAGNSSTGTPATKPGPFWIYKVGESLRRVIVAAGLTPSDSNLDLLTNAIQALSVTKASQAEVDAGTNDTKFVSPLKLLFGFSVLIATNGYMVFPSFLKNFTIQWGKVTVAGNTAQAATYLIPLQSRTVFHGNNGGSGVSVGSNLGRASTTSATLTGLVIENDDGASQEITWFSAGF